MKIKKLLLMAGLMVAAVPAFAADPVVINVKANTGSFTAGSGNYRIEWTSTETPGVILNCVKNNFLNNVSGDADLQYFVGLENPFAITVTSKSEDYYVASISFEAKLVESGTNVNVHINDDADVKITDDYQLFTATVSNGNPMVIHATGQNKGIYLHNFNITLKENVAEDDPCLEVDAAPTAAKIGDLQPSNIVDGRFNQFTTWYHLLDGKDFLTGSDLANAGTSYQGIYADEYLYCIVDGKLYNKAAGVAAPVANATVSESGILVGAKPVTVNFAQKWAPIVVEDGVITRNGDIVTNNLWHDLWTSNAEPIITFGGSANNMTTTDSANKTFVNTGNFQLETGGSSFTWSFAAAGVNFISDFSFLARKHGEYTSTTTVNGVTLTDKYKRIEASGFDGETSMASFAQVGTNGNGAEITDVYVTVRRLYGNYNTREGYRIYPKQGVERRIPAIARVFEGEHAGRLVTIYDYRHHGGDIGGGNISLEIAVSDDNGATWTTPDYLRDAEGNAVTHRPDNLAKGTASWSELQADNNAAWQAAYGDAALCADRESGRLLLMAVGGTLNFFNGRYNNPNQCVRWYSEDGGDTWTQPTNVTYDILDLFNGEPQYGKIDSQFIGSGRIMQSRYIKVGEYYRIYCVIGSQNNGGNTRNFMLYSDDFGLNWNVLGGADQCPTSTGAGDECKAEELPDGSVILAGRNRWGNRNFNIFRYTDVTKAEGTWTGHIVTDMGFGSINACNGEIMVLPAICNDDNTPCYVVLQSFPYGGGRNYVSIAFQGIKSGEKMIDANMFTSWEGRFRVANGGSVYSTMAWQANDKLAFFWEDTNCDGTYLDFTLEEITEGHYSYRVDKGNETAIRLTNELINERMKEDFTAKEGDYVGMLIKGSADAIANTADSYLATPSYNTYVKLNKLIYNGSVVPVVNNGIYRFTSGHDGTYTNYTNPLYLTANASTLVNSETADAHNLFKVEAIEGSDELFTLFNEQNNVYVDTLLAANNTSITVSAGRDNAGAFKFISDNTGHTAISNVGAKNSNYPAIHLAGGGKIVIWTNQAAASQWYMELMEAPEDYEAPEFTDPEYDSYEFDYANNRPYEAETAIEEVATPVRKDGVIFDLQGRRVLRPAHGVYIVNGNKVIL